MKPSIGKAIIGGIVGTAVFTAILYWVAPLMLPGPMDVAAGIGAILGVSWGTGMAVHWINGVILFPLVYALLLYRILPGGPLATGFWFGVLLFLGAELLYVPMTPDGAIFHGGQLMPIVGSFLGHIVYGLLLGGIAGGPAGAPVGVETGAGATEQL
ncbi:MAG: DUF6789 family protein [Gemmatimonadota bacterium]|nr:DUF6789 family protein [Gemmatimonadota bacterium]